MGLGNGRITGIGLGLGVGFGVIFRLTAPLFPAPDPLLPADRFVLFGLFDPTRGFFFFCVSRGFATGSLGLAGRSLATSGVWRSRLGPVFELLSLKPCSASGEFAGLGMG